MFYFRWRVQLQLQAALGLKEIRVSLGTSSLLVAKSRANQWFDFVNHAKLMKNAYQFSEISRNDYIQIMKKKITELQSKNIKERDFDYSTELIRKTLPDGTILEFDYGGDVEKESKAEKLYDSSRNSNSSLSNMLFSELFELFLEHKKKQTKPKKPLSLKMQKAYSLYARTIIEMIGDVDIGLIKKTDIEDLLEDYKKLAKRNLKDYRKLSVLELLEMEIDKEHLVSDKTVREVFAFLQGLFFFANSKEYLQKQLMVGLDVNFSERTNYGRYEDFEVMEILINVNKQKNIARKWICWIAAFSGARRGEIIQLRKQDIKLDKKTQRRYFLITDEAGSVKTKNAIRKVIIHNRLIDEGFLSYVESKQERLFDDVNAETFTKWFSDFRDGLGIEKYNDYRERRVFHSFRHTFVNKTLGQQNPPDKVQQVVGHEKSMLGITKDYVGRYDLYQLLDVVDCISYSS
jgi:integrase